MVMQGNASGHAPVERMTHKGMNAVAHAPVQWVGGAPSAQLPGSLQQTDCIVAMAVADVAAQRDMVGSCAT